MRLRFNEHFRDVFNVTQDTPMGDHFRESHPAADEGTIPLKVRVLYRSKDYPDRKVAESLMIEKNRPQLNTNLSSCPFFNFLIHRQAIYFLSLFSYSYFYYIFYSYFPILILILFSYSYYIFSYKDLCYFSFRRLSHLLLLSVFIYFICPFKVLYAFL